MVDADDPDHDIAWADSPTGKKSHVVDFSRESMLALGTDNDQHYASVCGRVPEYWNRRATAPERAADVCANCAKAILDGNPGDIDEDLLSRATGRPIDG